MDNIILALRREPAAQPRRTVSWVIDWFLAHDVKMRSQVARKERARVLGLFCAYRNSDGRLIGASDVEECIGADLVEFLSAQRQGSAQWTRRRWCNTVKRPFHEAAKLGLITHSPFQAVTERRGARGRDMTWDEFRAMLRRATPPMRRVLLFLRFSGARPEELRSLEWPHINFLARQIVKREHKTVNATAEPLPRVIQLSGQLMRLLLWIKRNHPHGGRWVFVNSFGGQWTTRALCKNVAAMRDAAGLPDDCKLYGTRHAWITEAVVSGLDVATVAELVGHKSIVTTQTYLHMAGKTSHLAAAMEKASVHFNRAGQRGTAQKIQTENEKLIELLTALLAQRCANPSGNGTV